MDPPSSKGRSPDDEIDVLKKAIEELEKVIDEKKEAESRSETQEPRMDTATTDSTPHSDASPHESIPHSSSSPRESAPLADEDELSLGDLEPDDLGDDDFLSPVRGAQQLPRHRVAQSDPFEQLGKASDDEAVVRGPSRNKQSQAGRRMRSGAPLPRMDRTEVRRAKLSSLSSVAPRTRPPADAGSGGRLEFEEERPRAQGTAIQPAEFAKVGLIARVLIGGVFVVLIIGLLKLSFISSQQDHSTGTEKEQARVALIDHVEQANATMVHFWTAPDLESKLEVTWDAERVGPIMHAYYENHRLPSSRNLADYSVISDRQAHMHSELPKEYILGSVEDEVGRITDVILRPTEERLLIDWEATFGYNGVRLAELLETKSTTPVTMRVVIVPADYYNFQFSDEERYQSFAMTVADPAEPRCYAFAERKSAAGIQLAKLFDDREPRSVAVILNLRFPIGKGSLCAEIVDLVSLHWARDVGSGESNGR